MRNFFLKSVILLMDIYICFQFLTTKNKAAVSTLGPVFANVVFYSLG